MTNRDLELSVSVVTYKNNLEMLKKLLYSLTRNNLRLKIFIIDNSPSKDIEALSDNDKIIYIHNHSNIGFGAGHNIAIRRIAGISRYHLVVNPDIYFEEGTLEKISTFMENHPDIGLLMPKVFYPDGSLQYLCRLLPYPLDLFLCKFRIPFISQYLSSIYELKSADYNKIQDIPYLSGCFMFLKNDVFNKVGSFDERFFMYFEDVDFCRRIKKQYRTVYYPEAVIYHGYEQGSDKDIRLLKEIFCSGIKYFNKWGWFIDAERTSINKEALASLRPNLR